MVTEGLWRSFASEIMTCPDAVEQEMSKFTEKTSLVQQTQKSVDEIYEHFLNIHHKEMERVLEKHGKTSKFGKSKPF